MRYPAAEKLEIIRLVEQSHLSVRRTLAKIGIPPTTFYRWYDRFVEHGPEGLEDRPPSPSRVWNRIPDAVRCRIGSWRWRLRSPSCRRANWRSGSLTQKSILAMVTLTSGVLMARSQRLLSAGCSNRTTSSPARPASSSGRPMSSKTRPRRQTRCGRLTSPI